MLCGTQIFWLGCIFINKNLLLFAVYDLGGHIYMTDKKSTTSYREIKIGNTLYRVTSVFTGEKDLGKTLEQLAVRRAMADLISCPAT